MPTFYTDVSENGRLARDPEGHEYADLGTARQQALKAARSILVERIAAGQDRPFIQLQIRDRSGVRLSTLTMAADLISAWS